MTLYRFPASLVMMSLSLCAHSGTLNIAVASNFTHTLKQIAQQFEKETDHKINIISGSTGKLYSQIYYGAPFDLFLAADDVRPEKLVDENRADPDNIQTYALGRLVFISNIDSDVCSNVLKSSAVKKLAIANPETAPYGLAAKQVLLNLKLWKTIKNTIVMGENIVQTLQFVATGNADAGFVAVSAVLQQQQQYSCQWDIPGTLYQPIRQKMVLLKNSGKRHIAQQFWQTMLSDETRQIIIKNGYLLPD